jgi:hypothetical protein
LAINYLPKSKKEILNFSPYYNIPLAKKYNVQIPIVKNLRNYQYITSFWKRHNKMAPPQSIESSADFVPFPPLPLFSDSNVWHVCCLWRFLPWLLLHLLITRHAPVAVQTSCAVVP